MEALLKSLATAPLPSLSPLTGNVKHDTTVELCTTANQDRTWKQPQPWLMSPVVTKHAVQTRPKTSADDTSLMETSKLRHAASKHISQMDRSQGTPYGRVMSPAQHAEVSQKLQQLVAHIQEVTKAVSSEHQTSANEHQPSESLSSPKRLLTPLTRQEMVMQRPSSKLSRLKSHPGVSSSWSGPISGLAKEQQQSSEQYHYSRISTPSIRPAQPLRASTPALLSLLMTANSRLGTAVTREPGGKVDIWTNENAAEHHASALPRSKTAPNTDTSSPLKRPGTSTPTIPAISPRSGTGACCTATTSIRAPGLDRAKVRPTRGTIYSVFEDLDQFGEGRVTYSTFEAAALLIGMREETARRFFSTIDTQGKGHITVQEWGRPDLEASLEDFTRLYIQKTRGEDGKYKGVGEIDNLYAALQMALVRLKLKNSGRSISHEKLLQAFKFIDRDSNGSLDKKEVLDAFNGMGIYVKPQVIDDAMKAFDKDKDGHIDYSEFVKTLFPNLGKGYKMHA